MFSLFLSLDIQLLNCRFKIQNKQFHGSQVPQTTKPVSVRPDAGLNNFFKPIALLSLKCFGYPQWYCGENPVYIHVAAKAKMPEGGCFKSCFTTPLSTSTLARTVPARAVKQRSEAHILLKYSHWIASALKSVHSSNSEEECITPKELRKDADMKKHN